MKIESKDTDIESLLDGSYFLIHGTMRTSMIFGMTSSLIRVKNISSVLWWLINAANSNSVSLTANKD
jgi:hypothetical protein